MGQRETSVVRQRRLQAELRRFREDSGRTQKAVAEALGWSTSKVLRIENGKANIAASDIRALLHYFGITDPSIAEDLLATARTREERWWDKDRPFLTQRFEKYLEYEDSSTRIRQYMGQMMPGLLQTEEYVRALCADYHQSDVEEIERSTRIRLRRQELLNRPNGPELLFVLDEAVIHRWVGGPHVMRRQLDWLKNLARRPNVTIHIVPFSRGMYAGLQGSSFTIFDLASDDFAVAKEDPHRDVIINDVETSSSYIEKFEAVQQLACLEEVDKIIDAVIDRLRHGAMV